MPEHTLSHSQSQMDPAPVDPRYLATTSRVDFLEEKRPFGFADNPTLA